MYRPDVVSLKQFYASSLGQVANIMVWRRFKALWPASKGEAVLGLGYATPYFSTDTAGDDVVLAGMPAMQGALYWPQGAKNRVALLDEACLPFGDNSFNRVFVIHALEHTHDPRGMLTELWRILIPGGRAIIVVPNRHGMWTRGGASPFGSGRPFSAGQLRDLIAESGLTLTRTESALYSPPYGANWLLRIASGVELLGRAFFPRLGGVLMVEAEKQIYAAVKEPARVRAPNVIAVRPVPAQV